MPDGMSLAIIFSIFLCVRASRGSEEEFIIPNNTIIVQLGSTATIPCRLPSLTEVDCAWQRDRQAVVVGKGLWKENYDWPQHESGDCSIVFRNINPKYHIGVWQCQIIDVNHMNSSKTSKPFKVIVASIPGNPIIDISSQGLVSSEEMFTTHTKVTVKDKSVLKLTCSSCCGIPKQKLMWKSGPRMDRNKTKPDFTESNNEVQLENGTWSVERTLSINIKDTDMQVGCGVVWAKVMPVKFHWVAVNVLHHPETINITTNATGQKYQASALKCPLSGNPTPSYAWSRRQSDGSFLPVTNGETQDNILYLFFTQDGDSGVYKCIATNNIEGKEQTGEALVNFSVVTVAPTTVGLHDKSKGYKNTTSVTKPKP